MRDVLRVKKIFNGRLLKLYVETQRFPNGYVGDLEVIYHPGAALIVPYKRRDKIIFIRQYRPVIDSSFWELPAGTRHKKETVLACAKRELREETGYVAAGWKKLGVIYPAPGYTTEMIHIFKASMLREVLARREEDEVIATEVLSVRQVRRLFRAGKIVDAKTICALALTGIRLR